MSTSGGPTLGGVTRETFKNLPGPNEKLDVLYDLLAEKLDEHDCQIKKLKGRKLLDTALSSLLGLLGGAAAVFWKH